MAQTVHLPPSSNLTLGTSTPAAHDEHHALVDSGFTWSSPSWDDDPGPKHSEFSEPGFRAPPMAGRATNDVRATPSLQDTQTGTATNRLRELRVDRARHANDEHTRV